MLPLIPKAFFLTRGIGVHKEQLTAFELALRDADIGLVDIASRVQRGHCRFGEYRMLTSFRS